MRTYVENRFYPVSELAVAKKTLASSLAQNEWFVCY